MCTLIDKIRLQIYYVMGLHSTQQGITVFNHKAASLNQRPVFYGYQKKHEHAKLHTLNKVKVTALIMFTFMDGREVKILILI